MDGIVKVRPILPSRPPGPPFTVTWALAGTTTGNQFDVRYRVGASGPWIFWRNDTATRSGVFGQGGQPVQVVAGRTYQFVVRSQKVRRASPAAGLPSGRSSPDPRRLTRDTCGPA